MRFTIIVGDGVEKWEKAAKCAKRRDADLIAAALFASYPWVQVWQFFGSAKRRKCLLCYTPQDKEKQAAWQQVPGA